MLESLNARLEETRELIRRREHLQAMQREAQRVLRQDLEKQKTLKAKLDDEQEDVDRLEGLTLTNLFATVFSTRNERLQKENEELLAVKLKHDEAEEAVRDGQQEVDRLLAEIAESDGADETYGNLLEEKAGILQSADNETAARLFRLTECLADLKADEKELREAINAGETARLAISRVETALDSAANWGTFDLLGGGMLATMAKHSKIDDARFQAHQAQRALHRFQEELHDAGERLAASISIDGFSTFADYFFDGLIADWLVQSKINNARTSCRSVKAQVDLALRTCRNRLRDVAGEREAVALERQEFLESR